MADNSQSITTTSLRQAGFWTHKPNDASYWNNRKLILPDQPGKADLIVINNGRAAFVEVKDSEMSFAFSEWRENQREWAELIENTFNTSYWIALRMGSDRPNANPEKYNPKRMWIIPRQAFISIENEVKLDQDSIPYLATKGYSKYLQENQLDAVHLFSKYHLRWEDGCYRFPNNHPFLAIFQGESNVAELPRARSAERSIPRIR